MLCDLNFEYVTFLCGSPHWIGIPSGNIELIQLVVPEIWRPIFFQIFHRLVLLTQGFIHVISFSTHTSFLPSVWLCAIVWLVPAWAWCLLSSHLFLMDWKKKVNKMSDETFLNVVTPPSKFNINPEKFPGPNRKVVFQPPFFKGYLKLLGCTV